MTLDSGVVRAMAGRMARSTIDRNSQDAGAFIPVVGPHVASRTLGDFSSSHQTVERIRFASILQSLAGTARDAGDPAVAKYIQGLIDEDLGEPRYSSGSESMDESVVPFALAIARLACELSQKLAEGVRRHPTPLERTKGIRAISNADPANPIKRALIDSLDTARRAQEALGGDGVMSIEPVRARLMRLAAIWLGETIEPILHEDLMQLLQDGDHRNLRSRYRLVTGVHKFDPWSVSLSKADSDGLTWQQVSWLNQLIRHLALASTAAHRTQQEMAFVLSLYDDSKSATYFKAISPALAPAMFYEAGSVWAASRANPAALESILAQAESCGCTSGSHPFHEGLAHLLWAEAAHARNVGQPKPIVALVIGFDRETERAIAREIALHSEVPGTCGTFLLVLPMEAPLRDDTGVDWRCFECVPSAEDPGYEIVREVDRDAEDEYFGRIVVVKMAGSPLDRERVAKLLPGRTQRMVIDEYDLVTHYMSRGPGLTQIVSDRLSGGYLYFLGMESDTLTDRVHIYAVGTHSRNDTVVSGAEEDSRLLFATTDCDLDRFCLEQRAGVWGASGVTSFVEMIAEYAPEIDIQRLTRMYEGTAAANEGAL